MSSLLSELYESTLQACQMIESSTVSRNFVTSGGQIEFILYNLIDLKQQYRQHFMPAFESELSENGKKHLTKAQQYKEQADLYRNMIPEPEVTNKALEALNKAIVLAPFEESAFLFQCFALRSYFHYHRDDLPGMLSDIDNALRFRTSYKLMERKAAILCRMNQPVKAWRFIKKVLSMANGGSGGRSSASSTAAKDQLKVFRELEKKLKPYRSKMNSGDDEIYGEAANPPELDSNNSLIIIDAKVGVQIAPETDRYRFYANDKIQSDTCLWDEQPVTFMYRYDGAGSRHICHRCFRLVRNQFWPCRHCSQVVFCSPECAGHADHRMECGLLDAIQRTLSVSAAQTYRTFVTMAPVSRFAALEERAQRFSLTEVLTSSGIENHQTTIQELFQLVQLRMMKQITRRQPLRTAKELCHAIILLMAYWYKTGADIEDMIDVYTVPEMVRMVDYLAGLLATVQISHYVWRDWETDDEDGIMNSVLHFQCLFGSVIGHGCKPNAEWFTDGRRFRIKAIRDIEPNETITISYGTKLNASLLERQTFLYKTYQMACYCQRCAAEIRHQFAIRCQRCYGPIPYDTNEMFHVCMRCERGYENPAVMVTIYEQFTGTRQLLCLSKAFSDVVSVEHLDYSLRTLASHVYLHSEPWLMMVDELCRHHYIRSGQFGPAVKWYQWILDNTSTTEFTDPIHLYTLIDPDRKTDHLIEELKRLTGWLDAFLIVLEQEDPTEEVDSSSYMATVGQLLSRAEEKLIQLEQRDHRNHRSRITLMDRLQMMPVLWTLTKQVRQLADRFEMLINKTNPIIQSDSVETKQCFIES